MESKVKRTKKPNFSDSETGKLLQEMCMERDVLTAKFQNAVTLKKKERAWEGIAERVNVVGCNNRTVAQVKTFF